MSEKELRKIYGEDYIPQSTQTSNALYDDERQWCDKNTDGGELAYDFEYAVLGVRSELFADT